MTQDIEKPRYKVQKAFTDSKGQAWKKDQYFTGDDSQIEQNVNNGNIVLVPAGQDTTPAA